MLRMAINGKPYTELNAIDSFERIFALTSIIPQFYVDDLASQTV